MHWRKTPRLIIQSAYTNPELSAMRLDITRNTVIPSLASQTLRPIVHLQLAEDDALAQTRLELFAATGCKVVPVWLKQWQLYGANWGLPDGRKIVGRVDDDDCLARDFIERTAAAAPDAGEFALVWPVGYVYWRQQIHRLRHNGNQFVTLVTDRQTDPHQEQHWQYPKLWKHIIVSNDPGWIWVRHGAAATSTLPRYRRQQLPRIDSARFPVNLRAITRVCDVAGVASANYAEHQRPELWRHVFAQNAANEPGQKDVESDTDDWYALRVAIDIDNTITRWPKTCKSLASGFPDVWILTGYSGPALPLETLMQQRREQLSQYLGEILVERLFNSGRIHICVASSQEGIARQKAEFCRDERIDLLIDDHDPYIAAVREVSPNTAVFKSIQ